MFKCIMTQRSAKLVKLALIASNNSSILENREPQGTSNQEGLIIEKQVSDQGLSSSNLTQELLQNHQHEDTDPYEDSGSSYHPSPSSEHDEEHSDGKLFFI